jgi:hypothetical protein
MIDGAIPTTMPDGVGPTYPEQIAATLTADQRRMILARKVDKGGEGAKSWESTFGLDSRLWERFSEDPYSPRLTKLGLRVFYAIIALKASGHKYHE